jgi:hypothetical protein
MIRHRRPRGQVLVIFAGGLVTLLLIGALVVDLGFSFMIRRAEQNAADPGAIAAARYIRTGPPVVPGGPGTPEPTKMRQAACFYAQQNGFFPGAAGNVDGCSPANDPNGAILTVNYPPSANAGRFSGTPGYVEVAITRPHQAFLASVVGIRSITVSTSAVAAYSAGDSNASSLIALDPSGACQTAQTHGTGDIVIHPVVTGTQGGYVHVNATCANGPADTSCSISSGQAALNIDGNSTLTAPKTYVAGTCKGDPADLIGPLEEGAVKIGDPLADLPPPSFGSPNPGAECGVGSGSFTTPTGPGATGCKFTGGTHTMQPGVYYGGWQISGSSVELVLEPGIYVFAGGGVRLTGGGTITSVQGGLGAPAPVLFFNTDNPVTRTGQADLDFNASGTLMVHGLDSGPYRGILVWNDGEGSNPTVEMRLGGQASIDIAGTIYNPKGGVWLDGGSGAGSSASVQIISWRWDVGGNSLLDMPYDPNSLYRFESKGLVR